MAKTKMRQLIYFKNIGFNGVGILSGNLVFNTVHFDISYIINLCITSIFDVLNFSHAY